MSDAARTEVTDRDLHITRAFAAPRDVVWTFFTQPARLATWFGPDGYSTPADSITIDLKVGGSWQLTMVPDADGPCGIMNGVITECDPPEYLEIRLDASSGEHDLGQLFLRIRFHDHGEKTRVTLHQGPFGDEDRHNTEVGWEMSFVKLDELLPAG